MREPLTKAWHQPSFPVLFLLLAVGLMAGYYALPQTLIDQVIVRYFAVVPGAHILDWLTPSYPVTSESTRILSPLANLNVLKGCEGTEVLLILYAAIIAMRRPWRATLVGLLVGSAVVFVLNQFRIVALYFVVAWQRDWFEAVHGFAAPILIVVLCGIGFLGWLRLTEPTTEPTTAAAPKQAEA